MKIATGGVRYCASCYGQYLDREHVDFEASYDGAAIKQENGDYFQVGDLIICSKCLSDAGKLIGLYPADELKQENEELGEALTKRDEEYVALHEAYSDLEKSLSSLADEKIKRPARKPKVQEQLGIAA